MKTYKQLYPRICAFENLYLAFIKARKGKIVIIATEGNRDIKSYSKEVIYIPNIEELFSPLLVALPLQLFAYYVAAKRGCNIDQPRNLAKSVTVE